MKHLIPVFIDITEWNKIPYSSTGGTRAKNIYEFPEDGSSYFFKGSKQNDDGTFKYPTEFWSEIVASKIGQLLGFNVLDYDIGYDLNDSQQIGCISKSMVISEINKLTEGVYFLRGFDPTYNPKLDESRYTFDFIKNTLNDYELTEFEPHFVKMLIFDAIIGNSDRHQENWGFISKFREVYEVTEWQSIEKIGLLDNLKLIYLKLIGAKKKYTDLRMKNSIPKKAILKMQSDIVETMFSPIYDSGCCLGREKEDDKVKKMLADQQMLNAFINRGRSEIRYDVGEKPKHFEFLQRLKADYEDVFEVIIKRISGTSFNGALKYLIDNIDREIPKELVRFKLSNDRKELMYKLITLRIEKLKKLK